MPLYSAYMGCSGHLYSIPAPAVVPSTVAPRPAGEPSFDGDEWADVSSGAVQLVRGLLRKDPVYTILVYSHACSG